MRETKDKQIGAFHYKVKQLADPKGMSLLVRLTKVLTPVLGAGLKGIPESSDGISLGELTTGAIGDALIALADRIAEDDMEYIYSTLATEATFSQDGSAWFPIASDSSHWSGRYLQKFQWIVFALEVNYSDFLGGPDSLARIVTMFQAVQKSKSPRTSTGGSSVSSVASTTPSVAEKSKKSGQ